MQNGLAGTFEYFENSGNLNSMENVQWKVEGMDCTNCALTIRMYLEKQGMKNVKVNFGTGDVAFDTNEINKEEKLAKGIHDLGYNVKDEDHAHGHDHAEDVKTPFLHTHLQRFWFCLPFTLVLMLHMIPGLHIHWLMNPWVQLGLTIPVYIVGMSFFGKSAWKSLRNGFPNMNVLMAVGATAAFVYSLVWHIDDQAADISCFMKQRLPSSPLFSLAIIWKMLLLNPRNVH